MIAQQVEGRHAASTALMGMALVSPVTIQEEQGNFPFAVKAI